MNSRSDRQNGFQHLISSLLQAHQQDMPGLLIVVADGQLVEVRLESLETLAAIMDFTKSIPYGMENDGT